MMNNTDAVATALERAAHLIEAKLAASVFPKLSALWDSWDVETIRAFHGALTAWHDGKAYMHTNDDDLVEKTPLDVFAEKYPTEWQSYADVVAAGAPKGPLFRTVMFEQADDIVDSLVATDDKYLLDELWGCLEWQNQLHISTKPVSNESLAGHDFDVHVRRFSSWTSQSYVAYMLSFEGGQYPIGDGAVLVRSENYPRVVHTFDSAIAFEKWCVANKDKVPECKPFMSKWKWQLEYVVEAHGTVHCNALEVVGVEGSGEYGMGYFEKIRDAAGFGDDDED